MAEPFKNLINADAVVRIATHVHAAHPAFPAQAFVAAATPGLEPLELKARAVHVADTLRAHLPAAWPDACAVLVAALPAPLDGEDAVSGGFWLWPVLTAVERHGLEHPAESLAALRQMTRRFSAEFAVRPYLARHPEVAWAALDAWCNDPDLHVRRLVSEGSRPRLPWGIRLQASVTDPTPGLALLDRLVDDPSPFVRRSVANHLGDVAKDHPDRAVAVGARWIAVDPGRAPLVRHALRDPLKKGFPPALALFGQGDAGIHVAELTVAPGVVSAGDSVTVSATLTAPVAAAVRVDVVWAWPGAAAGRWSEKTFRGPVRTLAAGEDWAMSTKLSLRPVTTRPLRPGTQRVSLRVNGVVHGPVTFTLA